MTAAHTLDWVAWALWMDVVVVVVRFYVPTIAKVKRRLGLCFKFHQKDWRSSGSKSRRGTPGLQGDGSFYHYTMVASTLDGRCESQRGKYQKLTI